MTENELANIENEVGLTDDVHWEWEPNSGLVHYNVGNMCAIIADSECNGDLICRMRNDIIPELLKEVRSLQSQLAQAQADLSAKTSGEAVAVGSVEALLSPEHVLEAMRDAYGSVSPFWETATLDHLPMASYSSLEHIGIEMFTAYRLLTPAPSEVSASPLDVPSQEPIAEDYISTEGLVYRQDVVGIHEGVVGQTPEKEGEIAE